jgi:hypothetical protein
MPCQFEYETSALKLLLSFFSCSIIINFNPKLVLVCSKYACSWFELESKLVEIEIYTSLS